MVLLEGSGSYKMHTIFSKWNIFVGKSGPWTQASKESIYQRIWTEHKHRKQWVGIYGIGQNKCETGMPVQKNI